MVALQHNAAHTVDIRCLCFGKIFLTVKAGIIWLSQLLAQGDMCMDPKFNWSSPSETISTLDQESILLIEIHDIFESVFPFSPDVLPN